jgi:branched-chain amino acid transport system permease protein
VAEPAELPLTVGAAAPLLVVPGVLLAVGSPLGPPLLSLALALVPMVAGLHLIAGQGGMPFLGQGVLAALGAAVAVETTGFLGLPPVAVLPLAGLAAALVALVLAPLLCRLARPALAGASLALAVLAAPLVPALPQTPADRLALDAATAVAAFGALLLAQLLSTALFGRALALAGREPALVAASGLDRLRLRRRALVLGALLAGVGGGALALAPPPGLADPAPPLTGLVLLAVIYIGGAGSLPGALAAAFAVILLPELVMGLVPVPFDLTLVVAALGVLMTVLVHAAGSPEPPSGRGAAHPRPLAGRP